MFLVLESRGGGRCGLGESHKRPTYHEPRRLASCMVLQLRRLQIARIRRHIIAYLKQIGLVCSASSMTQGRQALETALIFAIICIFTRPLSLRNTLTVLDERLVPSTERVVCCPPRPNKVTVLCTPADTLRSRADPVSGCSSLV